MFLKFLFFAISLLLLHSVAYAYSEDGNKLLESCGSAVSLMDSALPDDRLFDKQMDISYCFGMMNGITSLNKMYEVKDKNRAFFCLPAPNISNIQAARIVVKYLRDHPEELHFNGAGLAIHAFIVSFPCK